MFHCSTKRKELEERNNSEAGRSKMGTNDRVTEREG